MSRTRTLAAVALLCAVPGCGYTLIKKDVLAARRLPADSVQIVSLQAELEKYRAQHVVDSTRYADLLKEPPPPVPVVTANTDTLLRAREQEIQTLREQLAKVNAEMERIKRRLATPRS
jgi:hypothetical protein